MPAPSKLHSCEQCVKHFTSKRGLSQHNARQHASSKHKPAKETVASKYITLDSTADTTWHDMPTNIAQQFVASIVQKERSANQSEPVKDFLEQSLYGLDMDVLHFHMMQSLIDQQFEAMARNPSRPTFQIQIQLTNILSGMFDHYSRM